MLTNGYCTRCGFALPLGATFCVGCGLLLHQTNHSHGPMAKESPVTNRGLGAEQSTAQPPSEPYTQGSAQGPKGPAYAQAIRARIRHSRLPVVVATTAVIVVIMIGWVIAGSVQEVSGSKSTGSPIYSTTLVGQLIPYYGYQNETPWAPQGYTTYFINIQVIAQANASVYVTVGQVTLNLARGLSASASGSYEVLGGGTGITASSENPYSLTISIYFLSLNYTCYPSC
jgi:hypothetical protein